MSEINIESSTTESVVILSEVSSTSTLSSPSSLNTIDDEARRRKILSKLWGKGNKLSHKVRELDKNTINNNNDLSIHNDNEQKQLGDNSNNLSSYSSTNDLKSSIEDSSNSINSSKPLAVVKPIVVVKTGRIVSSSIDRTRVNSAASSTNITQIDETITVTERQSSSTITTDQTSNKKKKSHKDKDSKKKKTTRDQSVERDRSHHHHHHHHETDKSKKSSSSSKTYRQEQNEERSTNDNHHKSSHHHSSSTTSVSKTNRRSPSDDIHHPNRQSSRSTITKKDESSSTKKSTLSPIDHHRNSSKYESNNTHHNYSSHRHRRESSITLSPSPSKTHHSTTNKDRLSTTTKTSSSPKKDDRNSTTQIKSNRQQNESISNNKSINSNSPTDFHRHSSDTIGGDDDTHRHKTRTSNENLTNSSKSQKSLEISPEHHSSSFIKQDKSKTKENNDKNELNQEKSYSSRHNRRSYSRHRSKSKENKTNRKQIEPLNSDDSSNNHNKTNNEKNSTTVNENCHNDKKSNHRSSIPSSNDDYRRKSSSDYHRYDRHDSPSNYDRRHDYRHHHRIPSSSSSHSYYPHTHYVHHHHHHHYRSTSSRYYDHRRSISPRSHQHRSRYFSSTSSSLSLSPPSRRRSSTRTSSSSSRSPSSYSSISRTTSSSSRSSSRNNHHYYHHHHHEKKFRRSPTLEKIFLKASESIESISTQKNPNISSSSSSTHLIPIQTSSSSTINSDIQISSTINSLSETNTFYVENFSGFSVPPPPFISQPQQRCLKEITTEPITTSRRSVLNEVQTSTSTTLDEVIPIKTVQLNDISSNVRSGSSKPPRISRFSDITPSVTSEPILNTNLSVDTPLNYIQINENINCLPSSRRQQKRHNREVMECECTTSEYDRSRGIKACGHECLNRMLLIECGPMCPCGQWCTNRRFQRRSYVNHKLALFKTEMKGYGLRTKTPIRKGRFLVEYIGEVIDMDELGRRNKKYKRDGNIHQYVMSLIHGTVIDSTIKGNWARFINHSCEPNCVAEKWLVNGEYRMGIFSKRDLNINEEITIDYRFETFGTSDLTNEKCYCGASTCRGTINIKKNNNNLNQRQNRQQQPLDDDDILDYLRDNDTNEYIIPKTIDDIRQLIQIMSRTDSENVRTIELDLIKNSSQKQFELPRLFLECNGLHVLCSWMKDILTDDDDEQQYSNEFKYYLLDFIHSVLPIKDRTTVIKNGLLDLVYKKLKLPTSTIDNINNNDQEQINNLMNSILNHLDDTIISKLFHLYSTWMSLKERYIIPKRKEPEQPLNHHYRHHHHHHHHSSKHPSEEINSRLNFSTTRTSVIQQKTNDRPYGKRSFVVRETPRTQEQQLSKDERRKLFEQQYEDAEKAKAAAAAATNAESPSVQNEPPQKKQRTSDSAEPMVPSTPPQPQSSSMSNTTPWMFPTNTIYPHQIDQTFWIHQHLSQIPIDYIRSYIASIGQPISISNASIDKDEPPLPPPSKPDNENELSRIIYLPSGWSVAMCPSDSSVYFYNRKTMATSWIPPSLTIPTEHSVLHPPPPPPPLDLSPLSSAQIHEQRPPPHDQQQQQQQQISSSSRLPMKLLKHSHRQNRSHRQHNHHHQHHHINLNNKRKRLSIVESTTIIKEELHTPLKEETSMIISNEQFKQDEINDKKSLVEHTEEMSVDVPKVSIDENNVSITVKESSEINDNIDKQVSSNILSSSLKINRDILRKNISQHVHTTLKPYTKRTCKQGRIVSTDDIKYLVKKFTLAVLDKEIEKAKNDGIPLSSILTERVRLKTEVYVKKYMNKMGPIFQRHDTTVHPSSSSSQPPPQQTTTTTTTNPE
ncbi:unnamed protein product [Rotaria sordida]|uniref:[histone H3]-lysine(36) N-trimethyltransferase n=1 Tax=Rotaria sordida TaxID=392033 RepID=A0A815LP29_9BILA|nr:unnamed protein product [Rotaria sordida]CAF3733206.1 unnamed protein product [Rotaria sordida]